METWQRTASENEALESLLLKLGYAHLRFVPDVGYCALFPYLFTVGVVVGLNEVGMDGRICFECYAEAHYFLNTWDGNRLPEVGKEGCTAIKWRK